MGLDLLCPLQQRLTNLADKVEAAAGNISPLGIAMVLREMADEVGIIIKQEEMDAEDIT